MTRLACAIGVHTAGMSVEEGARRFEADTHLSGPAALSEARRATFDPTYGRYTWGKLAILDLREQARKHWGNGFTLLRFHTALMEPGLPAARPARHRPRPRLTRPSSRSRSGRAMTVVITARRGPSGRSRSASFGSSHLHKGS